jgi:predicted nucleic acid-binding protein
MTFGSIPAGSAIFLDTNILVYHLTAHPTLGQACTKLMRDIEQKLIGGFCSTHVMTEVAHRLMLIEASRRLGWPLAGSLKRLKKRPQEISKLTDFRLAIQQIPKTGIQVLTIDPGLIDVAADISQQMQLLSNDALIVAVMQKNGLNQLASHDKGFDKVPSIIRYDPS